MKRSEMVMHIARSLMSHLDWDRKERMEFADSILGDIEIEGMLPPEIVHRTMSIPETSIGYRTKNEWEPEDE